MFRVTFMVEDNKLGPAFLALARIGVRELSHVPVLNAEVVRGEVRARHGSAGEALVQEMNKRRLEQATASQIRDIVVAIGFQANSYSHIIGSAMKAGLLHRGPKNGMGYIYIITKRLPAPPKKGAK